MIPSAFLISKSAQSPSSSSSSKPSLSSSLPSIRISERELDSQDDSLSNEPFLAAKATKYFKKPLVEEIPAQNLPDGKRKNLEVKDFSLEAKEAKAEELTEEEEEGEDRKVRKVQELKAPKVEEAEEVEGAEAEEEVEEEAEEEAEEIKGEIWPLGKSLFVLSEAKEEALMEAFTKDTRAPLHIALNSVRKALSRKPEQGRDTELLLAPILNLFLTSQDNKSQIQVTLLVQWLLLGRGKGGTLREMSRVLKGGDKKLKMVLAALLKTTLEEVGRIRWLPAAHPPAEHSLVLSLSQLFGTILDCLKFDSAWDESNLRVPTKLTELLCNVFLTVSSKLSLVTLHQSRQQGTCNDFTSLGLLPKYLEVVRVLMSWNDRGRRQLFFEALKEVESALKKVEGFLEYSEENPGDGDDDENPKEVASLALQILWSSFGPCMHSEFGDFSTRKMKKALVERLLAPDDGEFNSGLRRLTSISLLLGQVKRKHLAELVQADELHLPLQQLASKVIQSEGQQASPSALPYIFFRKVSVGLDPSNLMGMVQPMLAMMDEKDGVSDVVAGFLAETISLDATEVLGELFQKLGGENPTQRKNALVVLRQVYQVNSKALQMEKLPEFSRRLALALLPHLRDVDLEQRKFAAELFAHVDPEFIAPQLCRLVYDKEARTRSAAEESLLALLSNHQRPLDTFHAFVQILRDFPRSLAPRPPAPLPQSPGDLGSLVAPTPAEAGTAGEEALDLERLLRVVKKWVGLVNQEMLTTAVLGLVRKVFAAPGDALLVRCLATMVPSSPSPVVSHAVIREVVRQMAEQTKLTESLLEPEGAGDRQALLQDLLFLRLAPVLVLKIVPAAAFVPLPYAPEPSIPDYWRETGPGGLQPEEGSLGTDCLVQIIQRIEQLYEFEQVRRLAAEILGKFPPEVSLPVILKKAESLVKARDIFVLKSYVFSLCHGLVNFESLMLPFLPRVTEILLTVLRWTPQSEAELQSLQNIQLGCIECLSIAVNLSASRSPRPSANQGSQPPPGSFDSVVECLLQLLRLGEETESVQICTVNVFTSSFKSLYFGGIPGATLSPGKPLITDDNHRTAQALSHRVGRALMDGAHHSTSKKSSGGAPRPKFTDHVGAACFQALFQMTYCLKGELGEFHEDLLDLTLSGLSSPHEKLREGALKLLGAIFFSRDQEGGKEGPKKTPQSLKLVQIRTMLESVSNLDTSAAARDLAEKLLAIFG